MLAKLFKNLNDYCTPSFQEGLDSGILLLQQLEFDASGDLLKEILEGNYRDGIDGFEEVENDGKRITGVFLDVVSSKLTKRYRFEVSGNNVFYQLENLADVKKDINYSEVDFARTKMFGQSKQPKKCVKGDSCGNTCIKSGLPCSKKPTPEQKDAIAKLLRNAETPVVVPPKPEIDYSDYQQVAALGSDFMRSHLKYIEPSQREKQLFDEIKAINDEIEFRIINNLSLKGLPGIEELEDLEEEHSRLFMARNPKNIAAFESFKKAIVDHHNLPQGYAEEKVKAIDIRVPSSIRPDTEKQLASFIELTGGKGANSLKEVYKSEPRAYATPDGEINIGSGNDSEVLHEFGHHVEFEHPDLHKAALDWVKSKSTSPTPVRLSEITGDDAYDDDEVAYPDKFIDPYAGKVYQETGGLDGIEAISMGIEHFADPILMERLHRRDRSHFELTVGILLKKQNANQTKA